MSVRGAAGGTGTYELATEVFARPYLEQHIIYAPLLDTSLLVNRSCLGLLQRIRDGRLVGSSPDDGQALATLIDLGLVRRVPAADEADAAGAEHPAAAGVENAGAEQAAYAPTACTLFLTTACNLRCRYCYASGGEHPQTMDPAVAEAAIDFVVANAAAAGDAPVLVAFHGGGEPTLAVSLFESCVARAREGCARAGLELSTALATNGVMSDDVREFVAANLTSVMVSLDGPASVQDRLRPRTDGGPSFAAANRTLARLADSPCQVGVRMTCTADSLAETVAGVRYLVQNYRLDVIQLEPVFMCGRSLKGGVQPPPVADFIETFRTCRALAACEGIPVVYSGARTGAPAHAFCQASAPSFNVTTSGEVTACYEVVDGDDPRAATFLFGAYDRTTRAFSFDEARIRDLQRLTVDNVPRCRRCFAKYNCAGDCPAKRLYPGSDEPMAYRCQINRRLTQDQLEEMLLGTTDTIALLGHQFGEDRRGIVDGPRAETEARQ